MFRAGVSRDVCSCVCVCAAVCVCSPHWPGSTEEMKLCNGHPRSAAQCVFFLQSHISHLTSHGSVSGGQFFWLSLFAFVFISFSFLAFIVFFVSFRSVFYRFLIVFSFLLFPSPPPPSFSPGRRPARLRKRRPLLAAGHAGPRRLEAHAHRTGQRAQGVCPAPLRAEAAKRQRSP